MNFLKYMMIVALGFNCAAQSIIFTKQINNNDNLYILSVDGKTTQLTNHPRKDSSPMVSPDGLHIVLTSERQGWWKIWSMDINGKNPIQLTFSSNAEYSPSWSPDGESIVFISTRDGNQDIYTMSSDGKNQKNVTQSSASDADPFWANNGYIYYASKRDQHYQISRIKPDGTGQEWITNSNGNKFMPQLSNNGSKILYYGDESGNTDIHILDLNTQKSTRLTNHPLLDMRPRWSKDNKFIVFERGNKGNNHHIFIMDTNGENIKQLTFKNYNYTPSFIPNQD